MHTLFVDGARVLLRRPHQSQGHRFGRWLLAAASRRHRNVLAGPALANKLARMAWSVLLQHENGYEAEVATRMS
ncbi:hypothetical protein [Microvirga tunisiensis]|uniref:hypothetical protein n=1 Tax=Microvirga tunisiensis TaxID=2108360 RepID=UPI00186572C9